MLLETPLVPAVLVAVVAALLGGVAAPNDAHGLDLRTAEKLRAAARRWRRRRQREAEVGDKEHDDSVCLSPKRKASDATQAGH